MRRSRSSFWTWLVIILLTSTCLLLLSGTAYLVNLPARATASFGSPSPSLGTTETIYLSLQLLLQEDDLLQPVDRNGTEISFEIQLGDTPGQVGRQLENLGVIRSATAFQDYLVYAGLDTRIQAGQYRLSPAWNAVQIAQQLQDANPTDAILVILAGWRMEEIAAALPTSGLGIDPDSFIASVRDRALEGYLLPGTYTLPRDTGLEPLLAQLVQTFDTAVSPEMRSGFTNQGLGLSQAVILASIVEREAVTADEMPLIASVFLNRLASGIKLDADPTVQYAVGYNSGQATWWTNPLSISDLNTDSPYNTYLYSGLPPGPISNPSLDALRAVAFPAQTPYYYFRAACDGSGRHVFAETYQEHLENACP